ncbi:MAG: halocyanin-like protein [Natronomonas sp.]|jgi:halocyanin-like protein|uniref:halocyanin domain-containing protein n=1 Tax=Natronomonas sp. TaxID=2184060 RepID=UPI003988D2FC
MSEFSRRRFVQGTGAAIATGMLAGCTGGDGGNGGGDGGGGEDVPQKIDDYLSGANEYDGSIEDHTGEDEVTVMVGAGNGLAFDPAAIRISSSTTVVWEWTGEGGSHNVASAEESESDFKSGDPVMEAGNTFQQSFDNTGIQLYFCEPHKSQGMKGAIEVVEE